MLLNVKAVVLVPVAIIAAVGIAGCSSNNSTPSSSSSSSSSGSPSATGSPSASNSSSSSPTKKSPSASPTASCTKTAIQAVLPSGETVTTFVCDTAGVEYWAAGKATKSGANTVFFLRSNGTKWTVVPTGEVCGTAMAGLPPKILDYCNGVTPSP